MALTCDGLCSPGYACPAGSTASNTPANVCPSGTYSLAGASVCTNCPAGTYGSFSGLSAATCTGMCQVRLGVWFCLIDLCSCARVHMPGVCAGVGVGVGVFD